MADGAKARYEALRVRREPFLRRARDYAALTLPTLLPPEGHTGYSELPQANQSFGARCVVNLASRLMTAYLPPGRPCFRLSVTPRALLEAGQTSTPPDTERLLSMAEKTVSGQIERANWRAPTTTAMQHLMVTGNILEQMLPNHSIRQFRLDQYVVCRDPSGEVLEIVIEEAIASPSLTDDLREYVKPDGMAQQNHLLYTCIKRRPDHWAVHQELEDRRLPNSEGQYALDKLPFSALRWAAVLGEDYGRSKIEEHEADLRAIDGLQRAMVEGAAMASRNLMMIRPNATGGLNLRRRIARARNGELIVGNPEDIGMLRFENVAGLQITNEQLMGLKREVGAAFLLGGSTVRDAERVTKAEIGMLVEELEGVLGGVYSMLNGAMMLPRITRIIFQMQAQGQLGEWPEGLVDPVVLTGFEALGREQDVVKVTNALSVLPGLPPEIAMDYPKWTVLLGKLFNGLGIADAVNSEAEAAQKAQARAMMEAAQKVVGQMAGATPGAA